MYKVYIAKLKRENSYPRTVFKVGITGSKDAMDRLMYDGPDEPYPIKNYFSNIKVMKSCWVKDQQQALTVEKHIMDTIKGNEKHFHNWYEKDPISGITECRKWNYDEFLKCCEIMDSFNFNVDF